MTAAITKGFILAIGLVLLIIAVQSNLHIACTAMAGTCLLMISVTR